MCVSKCGILGLSHSALRRVPAATCRPRVRGVGGGCRLEKKQYHSIFMLAGFQVCVGGGGGDERDGRDRGQGRGGAGLGGAVGCLRCPLL